MVQLCHGGPAARVHPPWECRSCCAAECEGKQPARCRPRVPAWPAHQTAARSLADWLWGYFVLDRTLTRVCHCCQVALAGTPERVHPKQQRFIVPRGLAGRRPRPGVVHGTLQCHDGDAPCDVSWVGSRCATASASSSCASGWTLLLRPPHFAGPLLHAQSRIELTGRPVHRVPGRAADPSTGGPARIPTYPAAQQQRGTPALEAAPLTPRWPGGDGTGPPQTAASPGAAGGSRLWYPPRPVKVQWIAQSCTKSILLEQIATMRRAPGNDHTSVCVRRPQLGCTPQADVQCCERQQARAG